MEHSFSFCATQVREADRDRFLATLFAPERHRAPLFALYAFDAEVVQVRDRISSPMPGEVRLQWWRDVLTGAGPGDPVGNPVAAGLLEAIRRFALPVSMLLDVIDAHTFDLYEEPIRTLAELEHYAFGTAATMIRLAACVLNDGAAPGHDLPFRSAGMALTITGMLQRLPVHSARGQRFLPDGILLRHGAVAADVYAGRVTGELRSALGELRQLAWSHLAALKTGEGVPQRLLPAFLPIALTPATLARMERADPFRPRVIPQWRRQWMLWRAAHNPGRFISVRPDDPGENADPG